MNKYQNRLNTQLFMNTSNYHDRYAEDRKQNSFAVSTTDLNQEKESSYNEIVDDYLSEHFKFVNKNRNKELKQLSIIRQNLNRKFKEIQTSCSLNKKYKYNSKQKQKQISSIGNTSHQFSILNPSFKSAGNTQTFQKAIYNCNQILRDLRLKEKMVEERRKILQSSSKQYAYSQPDDNKFPRLKFNQQSYLSSPAHKSLRKHYGLEQGDVRNIDNEQQKYKYQRSINRADLRNYRNRNYYNNEWNTHNSIPVRKQNIFQTNKRVDSLKRRHPRFTNYCEQDEQIMDKLYNISQLKTELSEDQQMSSPSFSPKHINHYKLKNNSSLVDSYSKQKDRKLRHLNSAKLKSLNFYQRVRNSRRKDN